MRRLQAADADREIIRWGLVPIGPEHYAVRQAQPAQRYGLDCGNTDSEWFPFKRNSLIRPYQSITLNFVSSPSGSLQLPSDHIMQFRNEHAKGVELTAPAYGQRMH